MRCRACNVILKDTEAVAKDKFGYIELCTPCFTLAEDSQIITPEMLDDFDVEDDWHDDEGE